MICVIFLPCPAPAVLSEHWLECISDLPRDASTPKPFMSRRPVQEETSRRLPTCLAKILWRGTGTQNPPLQDPSHQAQTTVEDRFHSSINLLLPKLLLRIYNYKKWTKNGLRIYIMNYSLTPMPTFYFSEKNEWTKYSSNSHLLSGSSSCEMFLWNHVCRGEWSVTGIVVWPRDGSRDQSFF